MQVTMSARRLAAMLVAGAVLTSGMSAALVQLVAAGDAGAVANQPKQESQSSPITSEDFQTFEEKVLGRLREVRGIQLGMRTRLDRVDEKLGAAKVDRIAELRKALGTLRLDVLLNTGAIKSRQTETNEALEKQAETLAALLTYTSGSFNALLVNTQDGVERGMQEMLLRVYRACVRDSDC